MRNTKRHWRGLFFILLIAALCGGLAVPAATLPARAAPQQQVTLQVIINEVAWSGTQADGNDEWIELFNPNNADINLTGWTLRAADGTPNINLSGVIPANGFYLLERTDNNVVSDILADQTYTGAMSNTVEVFELRDSTNTIVDTANQGGAAWFAGNATGNYSMERISVMADNASAWATNNGAVRNGLDAASNPINGTPKQPNSVTLALTATVTATETGTPTNTGTPTITGTATDTGTPTNTATATSTATNTPPSSVSGVVISEFRTRGPRGANDEFIELYNPTTGPIDISGWKINASNDAGSTSTRATIPPSTLLRSGQYYLIANSATSDGYNNPTVPPNLTYGTGITDSGGIALLRANDTVVDQVGMSARSAYKEGTPLSPLTTNTDQSYERKPGGAGNNCQDTNNNVNDFSGISPSDPQNYSSQLSRCGTLLTIPVLTVTTITSDAPDPSLVNTNVTVSVRVTGGSPAPSGIVNITGANTNCSITLNASGTGSCNVRFTSTGTKTLTATYIGDQTHLASVDTESHQVSTTIRTPTPTRIPSPIPPPPLLAINEFVPRPGRDWNMDGVINTDDEYIEILNHGVVDVNLSGYSLDDEVNIGSAPFRLPAENLRPGERRVFYGSESGLLLSDGGDGVRLLRPNGQLMDAYNYFVVRFPDQSYCRLPDNGGADDWNQNCFPTPGLQNSLSGNIVNPPTIGQPENLCPIADTLPADFVLAECLPFGNNIWNPAYWDRFGWYGEKHLPVSPGKWPVFVD